MEKTLTCVTRIERTMSPSERGVNRSGADLQLTQRTDGTPAQAIKPFRRLLRVGGPHVGIQGEGAVVADPARLADALVAAGN